MKKTRLVILWVTMVASVLINAQISARETFDIRSPANVRLNYEPFSGLPSFHTFHVKLVKPTRGSNNSDRDLTGRYSIRIRPSDLGAFDAKGAKNLLPISLRSIGVRELRRIDNEYYQELLVGTLNEDNMELEYEVSIPESLFAAPGVYTLPLDIDLVDSNTKQTIGKTRTTKLRVRVRPKLQTNIAGTRAASFEDGATFAVVDFGQLETGESEKVFIQVRGNQMARLKISSDNRGRMVHQSIPNLSVNYAVKINGRRSELRSPLTIAKSVAQDLQGSSYPMEIIVGDVSQSFAGNYHDVITISVTPQ